MTSESSTPISSLKIRDSSTDKVTCRLCRRQFAKYTCPTCNVPYCSLTCFRSQAHNQCSEGFYKKEIESDIHSGPSKTLQERQKMMELLKNFEEGSSVQEPLQEGEECDDQENLAERFGGINLESTSSEELWAMLTPTERSKFMKVFNDPTSELARQLLSSEQLEKEIQEPWWETPNTNEGDSEDSLQDHDHLTGRQYGRRPSFMTIPESMVKPFQLGQSLVYNICAICISYAYITRHLGTSPLSQLESGNPDYHEARRLMTQMVPFLTDRKSTIVYPNLSAVITDIWSKFDLGIMTGDLFSLLLRDSAQLLKPLLITPVAYVSAGVPVSGKMISPSHPHSMAVLMHSDLYSMFSNSHAHASQDKSKQPKDTPTCHKLLFYAAHIVATPSLILDSLADEMTMRAKGYRSRENIGGLEERRVDAGIDVGDLIMDVTHT